MNLELIRSDLAKLASGIDEASTKSPTIALERILQDLEAMLLATAQSHHPTAATDLRQLRDAHQRLVVTMRHWNPDTTIVAAALKDALNHWPAPAPQPQNDQ